MAKPSRAQRLERAGLDAPMSAEDLRRKAIERQKARFGRVIDPGLLELEAPKGSTTRVPKRVPKRGPALVCQRSDVDVDVLEILFPMPPMLTNSDKGRSRHWRALEGEKKRYWKRLDELQLVGLIPKPQRRAIARGTLRSTMTLGSRMDEDNAVARHKWAIDWLATRGYVENDRLLKWERFPVQIIRRDGEYTIALTVTRAQGEE
jgi:hypothetical protein